MGKLKSQATSATFVYILFYPFIVTPVTLSIIALCLSYLVYPALVVVYSCVCVCVCVCVVQSLPVVVPDFERLAVLAIVSEGRRFLLSRILEWVDFSSFSAIE